MFVFNFLEDKPAHIVDCADIQMLLTTEKALVFQILSFSSLSVAQLFTHSQYEDIAEAGKTFYNSKPLVLSNVSVPDRMPYLSWSGFYGAPVLTMDRVNSDSVFDMVSILGRKLKQLSLTRCFTFPFSKGYKRVTSVDINENVEIKLKKCNFDVEYDGKTVTFTHHAVVRQPTTNPTLSPYPVERLCIIVDLATLVLISTVRPRIFDRTIRTPTQVSSLRAQISYFFRIFM